LPPLKGILKNSDASKRPNDTALVRALEQWKTLRRPNGNTLCEREKPAIYARNYQSESVFCKLFSIMNRREMVGSTIATKRAEHREAIRRNEEAVKRRPEKSTFIR
jgi:hypothetical protein